MRGRGSGLASGSLWASIAAMTAAARSPTIHETVERTSITRQ